MKQITVVDDRDENSYHVALPDQFWQKENNQIMGSLKARANADK